MQLVLLYVAVSQKIFRFICSAFSNSRAQDAEEISLWEISLLLAVGWLSVTLVASFLSASILVNLLAVQTEKLSKL